MEGLGKEFNVIPVASGLHVSLKNASGVTYVCYENGGAQAIAIKESIAGASEQALAVVDHLYSSDGVGSTWSRDTVDANGALGTGDAAIVKQDTTAYDCASFYIDASELSAGFDSVEVTIDGAGICIAIVHLLAQRSPVNLGTSAV